MPITIACPGCAKRYSLGDETAGKTARCKQCGQVFKVPLPPAAAPASSGSRPPVAPPPRTSAAVFDDIPGLAPLDEPLPPPAPPRSSTATRPIPPPPARPPAPARPPVGGSGMPPDPPRKSAAPLDDFGAHEVLDDFPEEPRDTDLPPPPAWAVEKPKGSKRRGSSDGPLGALQAMPLPAMIFLGGSAALWLFLLAVVVPSMGGKGGAANAAPGNPGPPQALVNPQGAPPAAAPPAVAGSFPNLPPALNGLYPAGTNPANQPEPGPQPYVEVFVSGVPDGETSGAIGEILGKSTDAPGGQISVWTNSSSAFRIWPVSNPQAFRSKVFADQGRTEVKGHQLYVSGWQPNPATVADYKARHAEEAKARLVANAPDPTIAPGTPPIDAALTKIQSGKNNLVQDGCKQLATVLPEDARKDEVVQALIPILSNPDGWTAKEAAKALGNWRNDEAEKTLGHTLLATSDGGLREEASKALLRYDTPGSLESLGRFMIETTDGFKAKDVLSALIKRGTPEVIPLVIQYVEKSDDLFGRADAIRALGRMKVAQAAPAIASRIKDNRGEAPDALRAIGPGAEPALIDLLKDSDSEKRKLACEVLRDIGGQDTLDVMKKLPADSDPFVRDEAVKAAQAITARAKSQKRDDPPAKSKDNPFDKRPVKSRG